MSKKNTTIWKTKQVGNKKMMICQNSNPALSKYSEYVPEEGVCESWSEVGTDTSAILCWHCVSRSVNNIRV